MKKPKIHERINSALEKSNLEDRLSSLKHIYKGVDIKNKPSVQVLIDRTMELMGLEPE